MGAYLPMVADHLLTQIVSSRRALIGAAAWVFAVSAILKALISLCLLTDSWRHQKMLVIDSVLTGLFAATIAWTLLTMVRARRRRLIEYVRRVADLNHHIRNALQVIVYQAALFQADPKGVENVEQAVRRVDAALQEIFPIMGDDRRQNLSGAGRDLIH